MSENPSTKLLDIAKLDLAKVERSVVASLSADELLIMELSMSLHEMLDIYWGKGDGGRPPSFITGAKRRLKKAAIRLYGSSLGNQ